MSGELIFFVLSRRNFNRTNSLSGSVYPVRKDVAFDGSHKCIKKIIKTVDRKFYVKTKELLISKL